MRSPPNRLATCLAIAITLFAPITMTYAGAAELRIGAGANPFGGLAIIAKQAGFLTEELKAAGVADTKVTWALFTSGPPLNEALASGNLDVVVAGDTPTLLARAAGIDLVAIAVGTFGETNNAAVVPVNSPIKTVKDFKGKKIATVKGTTAHHLALLALKEAGLTTNDVELINVPITDVATTLQKGDIDAAFIWEPTLSALELKGEVRIVRDGKGLKDAVGIVGATESFLKANPVQARALLKAFNRAAHLLENDRSQAAKLLAAEINLPLNIAERALTRFSYDLVFRPDQVTTLRNAVIHLRENKILRSDVDIDKFIDRSVAESIGLK